MSDATVHLPVQRQLSSPCSSARWRVDSETSYFGLICLVSPPLPQVHISKRLTRKAVADSSKHAIVFLLDVASGQIGHATCLSSSEHYQSRTSPRCVTNFSLQVTYMTDMKRACDLFECESIVILSLIQGLSFIQNR